MSGLEEGKDLLLLRGPLEGGVVCHEKNITPVVRLSTGFGEFVLLLVDGNSLKPTISFLLLLDDFLLELSFETSDKSIAIFYDLIALPAIFSCFV